jgi:DNA-binding transcriptional LysR family regulator
MAETTIELEVLVRSADSGSLSEAARSLGVTPATASAAIKRLETRLGARLLLRSTRKLQLTPDGERYLPHARQALAALRAGQLSLGHSRRLIAGVLRITAPADLGRNHVFGWLERFVTEYPDVRLQLLLSDRLSDFFREPVDVALRYGTLADSAMVAVQLARLQRVLCAAPAYVAEFAAPLEPEELSTHAAVCHMIDGRPWDRWKLHSQERRVEVKLTPRWVFDDGEMVRRAALQGLGVAHKLLPDVDADLAARRLLRILPDWEGESVPLSLVYPERRLSPALRALVAFIREQARELPGAIA